MNYLDEAFRTALADIKQGFKKKGDQKRFAEAAGIDPTYLNHIIQGRNFGSEQVRRNIAKAAGYSYDDFLKHGRNLLGLETTPVAKPAVSPDVSAYLEKTRAILESPKGEALKIVIDSMSGSP